MEEYTIACYKFYDRKGRRLSTFSRYIDQDTIEVVTIPCSKNDRFIKRTGLAFYKDYVLAGLPLPKHSLISILNPLPEQGTYSTLLRYASTNLYCMTKETKVINVNKLKEVKYAKK